MKRCTRFTTKPLNCIHPFATSIFYIYTQHIDRLHESNPSLAFVLKRIWAVRWHIKNTHIKCLNALECLDGYAGIQGAGVCKDTSFVDNKEELQRGLGHWEGLIGEVVNESGWREGDVGGSSTGHIEQDAPDDEISEGILDLTEQFSQDL